MIQTYIPPKAQLDASRFSSDHALCKCGTVLSRHDFDTDYLGRTISLCPSCGPQLVPKRFGAPTIPRKIPEIKEVRICACGQPIVYKSRCAKRDACRDCQKILTCEKLAGYNEKRTAARRMNAIAVGRKLA